MNVEREYIRGLFQENFSSYRNKKIVIYGTGFGTKHIIEEFPDFNIIGLLDGFKDQGNIFGKEIISLEQFEECTPDIVIVVARVNSTKVIYRRVEEICKNNNIQVFDINGRDLVQFYSEEVHEAHDYFEVSEQSIKKAINEHEVISFDIFDTLIMRKVLFPHDVFIVVQNEAEKAMELGFDFHNERVFAAKELRLNTDPTIYEIYDLLQEKTAITDEVKQLLMDLEIEIEKKVLMAREKMVEIFNYAVESGKQVNLISDMYLPKEFISEILLSLGIKGYANIFVSCEYKTSKEQELFSIYKSKVAGESYLHIGDNVEADFNSAHSNGLQGFQILSAVDMLEISSYKKLLNTTKSFEERNMAALFIAKAFNNPFALYQSDAKLTVKEARDIGYLFFAPLLTNFMCWLIEEVEKEGCDYILFAARDGYLLQKLYEIANQHFTECNFPESNYFLTSRLASVSAGVRDEQDILYVSRMNFEGRPEEMLERRFFLDADEIDLFSSEKHRNIEEYVIKHKDRILKKSAQLRENYLRYISGCQIDQKNRLAFFELASSGTCQMALSSIIDKHLVGFYFLKLQEEYEKKQLLDIKSWYKSNEQLESTLYLYEFNRFIECIISSTDGSLSHFDENGEPVFLESERTAIEIEFFQEVRAGIEAYFKEFIVLKSNETSSLDATSNCELFLSFAQRKFTLLENDVLNNFTTTEVFMNRVYKLGAFLT